MIAALLIQAMSLGAIGAQAMPARGCAAFLWSREARPELIGMAAAEAGTLRLQLGGKPVTLVRTGAQGASVRGFQAEARYAGGGVDATLTMTVTERPDLADGALIGDALLSVAQAGQDALVVPVGGMIGCTGGTR